MNNDTIIACSSGNSANVAISIIRISGNEFLKSIKNFIPVDENKLKSRKAFFTKLYDIDGSVVDEVVVVYFKGPNSYNGEDILEISCHGNKLNVQKIISIFIENCSFRLANPGEFTERALRNGKMNASQVEGLDLLLNANNIFSLKQGYSLLSGELQDDFLKLHQVYMNHKSAIELGFDFLDDIGEDGFNENFNTSLKELENLVNKLNKRASISTNGLIEPEIVLFGPPNAGKSTLFNQILGSNRAIVSPQAGTTRDYISEGISIKNNAFKIIDTAGIRFSNDSIESQGIELSKNFAQKAFFKILLVDTSTEFDYESFKNFNYDLCLITHSKYGYDGSNANFNKLLNDIGPIEPKSIAPIGPKKENCPIEPKHIAPIGPKKEDGPIEPKSTAPIGPKKENGPIEPKSIAPIGPIHSVDLLQTDIGDIVLDLVLEKFESVLDFDPILIERHSHKINKIYLNLQNYLHTLRDIDDLAIIASEFNSVGVCISELIGIVSPDDILGNIFNSFCIGK